MARHGWVGKRWQTRAGRPRGGRPFDDTSLYRLSTNVLYAGKVRYKDEIHDGEQPALVDAGTFGRVQALLRSHGSEVGPTSLQRFSALLKGLLRCLPCDRALTPSHTMRMGGLRYRYRHITARRVNRCGKSVQASNSRAPVGYRIVEPVQSRS